VRYVDQANVVGSHIQELPGSTHTITKARRDVPNRGENAMSLAYRDAVLAKNPVAYWRLGEAAGPTAVDETGNGYDGTYFGAPTYGQPGAIQGDPNTAVQFNGADYVEIPNSVNFSQPTSGNGLTVEVWMRPDDLSFPGHSSSGSSENPYVHWLGKGEAGQQEWAFRFYSDDQQSAAARPNRISAYIWSPAGSEGAGAYFQQTIGAGQWMHIVASYEPGDKDTCPPKGVHIYLNGQQQQGPFDIGTLYCNPCFAILPANGTAPLRLATRDLASFFIGALDEVAIYPQVLTPAQILENYQLGVS
jgi:hypothetical protein